MAQLERIGMARSRVPLPKAIIPFILANLDGFDISIEDGDRIVITPKADAVVAPQSHKTLRAFFDRAGGAQAGRSVAPPSPRIVQRPKFTYKVEKADYTPKQAKAFGMSKPRLKVYEIIHAAEEKGVGYKTIRQKSELPHGSVQQILHWLRKQKLISGTPGEVE